MADSGVWTTALTFLPLANAIIGIVAVVAAVVVGALLLRQQEKHRKQELAQEEERRSVRLNIFARFTYDLSRGGARDRLQVSIVNHGLRAVTLTRLSVKNGRGALLDLPVVPDSKHSNGQCHSSSGPLPHRMEPMSNYELEVTLNEEFEKNRFIPQRIRVEWAGVFFVEEDIYVPPNFPPSA